MLVWVALGRATTARGEASPAASGAVGKITFNRDIRPILSDNCFFCHGPDKSHRKGKFRLDDSESAIKKGAIVPGKVGESTLVDRIYTKDPDDLMPPAESHKKLTEGQKELLKKWIEQGAQYEPFWAYVVPKRPPVPAVKDARWVRNPIDAFILAALEAQGIAPSPVADRRTLLRRLSLDLVGLPPTPEEVSAFVDDKSPDAYEKQVDRLMASPHYGERMAVPWLDAVRFADTVGFHGDQNQNVFPYRDYVINAFNSNKPFDQFTIEQLGGDLLPNPTTEQLVATGYNRLNMMTREGGAQPKEYLAKYAADRVRTLAAAWLGSTLGCCECHDHKFDPFKTKDFYSLEAFWADVKEWGVYMDYGYTPNPDLRGWSNDHPFPPEIVVDSPYLKKRQEQLLERIGRISCEAVARLRQDAPGASEWNNWRRRTAEFLAKDPRGWVDVEPMGLSDEQSLADGEHGKSQAAPDKIVEAVAAPGEVDAVLFLGPTPEDDKVEFALPPGFDGIVAAIRVEALPHAKHGGGVLRGQKETTVQVRATLTRKGDKRAQRLAFSEADADEKQAQYANGFPVLGIMGGWKTSTAHLRQVQTAVYELTDPVQAGGGDTLTLTLGKNALGCIRVSISPLAGPLPSDESYGAFPATLAESLLAGDDAAAADPRAARAFLLSQPGLTETQADARSQVRDLQGEVRQCWDGKSPSLVTVAQEPRVMRVLARGNWQDETGEIVQPNTPAFLPPLPGAQGRRLTRLDLARWLVAPDNPLTARAVINRTWKQFFGNGICNSVEDLGAQGEQPSHPELLDWLAVEFRDPSTGSPLAGGSKAWDMKHMVRLIVTSATYMQDSNQRPELATIDPANRMLASQNPRRLEAEFVRDNALFAAGLLNVADVGGPSVHPYQPEGYYANIQFPSRTYVADADERQYRRGLYMHRQRTFLHPMLANFDATSREDAVCTRVVSNTPQQALTLLNDPEFVEAARVLGEHAISGAKDDAGRIDFVYQQVLSRLPGANERDSLAAFVAEQREYYRNNAADADKLLHVGLAPVPAGLDESELAAWATVCRVVLNLHESITRY